MKKITFAAAILLLMAILIIINISDTDMHGLNLINHTQETNNSPEIERINWGQKAREIAVQDESVQELIGGTSFSVPSGIVWNETYAELFYRIGGHHETITSNTSKGGRMVGGEIYKIAIDLNNGTVLYIEEEKNQTTLNWIKNISDSVTCDVKKKEN